MKKTLTQRIRKFLDDRVKFHTKEAENFQSMLDRISNTTLTDEELNSLLGVLKFWNNKRELEGKDEQSI